MIILSHFQAQEILSFSLIGKNEFSVSLDIGRSVSNVKIEGKKIVFSKSESAPLSEISKIAKDEKSCYYLNCGKFQKLAFFSDETNLYYKLFPTGSAPTIEISGIRMHRVKGTNPWEDSKSKIGSISPLSGKVLDTCSGLGYTAIIASEKADEVFTFEKDANVIEMEKLNPWSKELFTSANIKQENKSIIDEIGRFPDNFFDFIIHDPPSIIIAGELYSNDFYNALFSKLKNGGKIYHYTGNPGAKFRKMDVMASVMKRLKEIGFINVRKAEGTLGITAGKL